MWFISSLSRYYDERSGVRSNGDQQLGLRDRLESSRMSEIALGSNERKHGKL